MIGTGEAARGGEVGRAVAGAVRAVGGVVRLVLGAGLAVGLVAAILGRAGADRAGEPVWADRDALPFRVGSRPGSGVPWPDPDRFLDPADGRPVVPAFPPGGEFWGSAWAPWADAAGRTQLVGVWMDSTWRDSALLRLSQPDGAVLDRVSLEAGQPGWSGPPCWFPDRSERVLLAGGDGTLHRLDFAGPDPGPPRARPLPWRGGPGRGLLKLTDLSWPRHPRSSRLVLAAAIPRPERRASPGPDRFALWWLRLDPEASAVVAAAPLDPGEDEDEGGGGAPPDRRFPTASPPDAGPPRLAWVEQDAGRDVGGWRLRVAALAFDPETGDPSVDATRARTLAEGCEAAAPAFSPDGRRLGYVARGPRGLALRWADATDPPGPSLARLAPIGPGRAE